MDVVDEAIDTFGKAANVAMLVGVHFSSNLAGSEDPHVTHPLGLGQPRLPCR